MVPNNGVWECHRPATLEMFQSMQTDLLCCSGRGKDRANRMRSCRVHEQAIDAFIKKKSEN